MGETIFCIILGGFLFYILPRAIKHEATLKEERIKAEKEREELNKAMICPHCQEKGMVRTSPITQKKGVSGGKATAAIFTGGVSLLATGLSRKEAVTQAHCDNCGSTWNF